MKPKMDTKLVANCAADFPSLSRVVHGRNLIYLDGPGGSQVPVKVIDAISNYYRTSNANTHGFFVTTKETDAVIEEARNKTAIFLGAENLNTISFGQNMTTLNFSLSKALARYLPAGSEIIITQLDHEANRGPWLRMQDQGFKIQEVALKENGTLDYQDFQSKISSRTSLVAVGYASNALGTVNDLLKIRAWTKKVGALMLVDAVHYVPHFSVDVQQLDCDFLLCSAYKFYGPHVGILYSRPGLLDKLDTDRLTTQEQKAPYLMETGTLNHAALAGVSAAIDYLRDFGDGSELRSRLVHAMQQIYIHEFALCLALYQGLNSIAGLKIIGPPLDPLGHTPTLSFTIGGYSPEQVCRHLAQKSICAWDGHFYAQRAIEKLGLLEQGGVTRLGISMYTSEDDIEHTVESIRELAGKGEKKENLRMKR